MSKTKLILFPFAGGHSNAFKDFEKECLNVLDVECKCIDYPGHGRRSRENLITDLNELVDDIYQTYGHLFEGRFYFLGYSMGALVAQKMIRKLINESKPLPISNIVMACRSPRRIAEKVDKISHLPDHEFIQRIIDFGGIDEKIQTHEGLLEYFIPIIRADYVAYENHSFQEQSPVPVPIHVFGGNEDDIHENDLHAWHEETDAGYDVVMQKGGHFFLFNDMNSVLSGLTKIFSNELIFQE